MPDPAPKPAANLLTDPLLKEAPTLEGFKVLDPVVLYAKVGEGGMGAVYRGWHFNLDVDVAVKCLRPSLAAEEPDYVKRFEREARLAASIDHQNVVRVKDVREKGGLHYLVMDFVRGETARERVRRKGKLSEKEALAILFGATAGLAEAHKRGIVHRDIKPDNIMVSLEGRVKLADLGLAKSQSRLDGRSVSMPTSRIMGTPQFMPPEQWKTTDVEPAADIWALGATFFYLVTGRSSWPGQRRGQPDFDYLNELSQRIQNEDHPNLDAERPDLRPQVHQIFGRCVQRDAKDRYQNAQELLKELKKLAIDDEEEVLLDPEAGSGIARAGVVTPPPRQTVLRIRAQVEPTAEGKASATEPEPAGPQAPKTEGETRPIGSSRVGAPAKRSRLPLLLGALGLVGGLGWGASQGWFGGTALVEPKPGEAKLAATGESGASAPPSSAPPKPAEDARARARTALATGRQLAPQKGQLDGAITALEEALRLDPELSEVKPLLAGALSQRAKEIGDSDLDAAFTLCRRAVELKPGDAVLLARHEELRSKLAARIVAGLTLATPKAGTLLSSRQVVLEDGRAEGKNMRAVRVALVASGSATAFPSESVEATVIGGTWSGACEAPADGAYELWIEGEDSNGVKATLPPRTLGIDTVEPVVELLQPLADTTVGAKVVVAGTVQDASACTVQVNGKAAQVAGERWSAELLFGDGKQELRVEATDAVGRKSAVVTRSLVVDAVAPALMVLAPPKVTKQTQVTVTGTVKDLGAGELRVDGKVVTPERDGAFSAVVALGSDQAYSIEVEAKDLYGNRSRQQVQIRRDTVGPVLEWTSPDPSRPVRAGEVEVSGFCSDDSAVKSVTVNDQPAAVRGSGWTAKVMVRAASGGKATPTRVTVVATDALGNSSEPLVRQLQVAMPFADRIGVDFEAVASAGTGFDGLPKRLRHRATGIEFVLIAPGAFDMGSPPGEAGRQEDETLHRVTLTEPFYLAETEVSVAQWRGYAQATGYKTEAEASGKGGYTHRFNAEGKGEYVQLTDAVWTNPLPYWTEKKNFQVDGTQPVTQISWNDAMSFCRHYKIQLPTEAQWEYACRGGQAARFWWGDVEEQGLGKVNGADRGGDSRVINFANKFDFDDGFQFTAPVNRNVTPNAFGLKDMLGNVWEWCADQADYIDGKAVTNTYDGAVTDPLCLSGARRVCRGGGWNSGPAYCRSADRVCSGPSGANDDLGFRPALVARPPVK